MIQERLIQKFEYVWIDESKILRSKVKVVHLVDGGEVDAKDWSQKNFILKPIKNYNNPFDYHWPQSQGAMGKLVLCELFNEDQTPHSSNVRSQFDDKEEIPIQLQQEYFLEGFPNAGLTRPVRDSSITSNVIVPVSYTGRPMDLIDEDWPDLGVVGQRKDTAYCGTGSYNVAGRKLAEEHMDHCLDAGIGIDELEAQEIVGRWKYNYSGFGGKNSADDMLMSRYIMQRLSEEHNVKVTWIDEEPWCPCNPYEIVKEILSG